MLILRWSQVRTRSTKTRTSQAEATHLSEQFSRFFDEGRCLVGFAHLEVDNGSTTKSATGHGGRTSVACQVDQLLKVKLRFSRRSSLRKSGRERKQAVQKTLEMIVPCVSGESSKRQALGKLTSDARAPIELSRRSIVRGSFLVASTASLGGCSEGGREELVDSTVKGLSEMGDAALVTVGLAVRRETFLTALFQRR